MLHVREAAPDGPGQAVPGLRLAVVALRSPAMTLVEPAGPLRSTVRAGAGRAAVPGSRRRPRPPCWRAPWRGRAQRGRSLSVDGAGVEQATVLHRPGRPQDLAARAPQEAWLRVVAEAAQRHRAADRLGQDRAGFAQTEYLGGSKSLKRRGRAVDQTFLCIVRTPSPRQKSCLSHGIIVG